MFIRASTLAFLITTPLLSYGQDLDASVVRVVDGDTVILQWDKEPERVRIVGIDTPEIVAHNQPVECFGQEASNHAKSLMKPGDRVIFEFDQERDKYRRALGYIRLGDDSDFGLRMIQDGYSYAYRKFDHPRKLQYTTAESRARLNKVGLWADDTCRSAPQSVEQTVSAWQQYLKWLQNFIEIVQKIINIFI